MLRDDFVAGQTTANLVSTMTDIDGETVYGTVDYDKGTVTIDFTKLGSTIYSNGDGIRSSFTWRDDYDQRLDTAHSYAQISWVAQIANSQRQWSFNLSRPDPSKANENGDYDYGHLREGKNTFEAWLDLNGDGVWTAGEPYGVATDVDVGWSKAAFAIELTDTTPQMFRIDLAAAMANNSFESQKTLNDRGMWSSLDDSTRAVRDRYVGDSMPADTETSVRIRLVRSALNNYDSRLLSSGKAYYADDVVCDITKNPTVDPLLTERDLLQTGQLDLDWGAFADVASNLAVAYAYVTNASYRVVVGNGACSISDSSTNINNLATAFVNRYEVGVLGAQTRCVPVNVNSTVYGARPTFSWVHTNLINKVYPAFRLRVWKSDGTTLVYDSGDRKAPPRDTDGIYSWAPPIYAGMVTPQGVVFATTNNYKWSVSMLDAKFYTPNQSEIKADFRLECSGVGGGVSDYGSIKATVKYMGPGKTSFSPSTLAGLVHVQAFESPDFSGEPAAEGFLQDGDIMTSKTNNASNCLIRGLPMGTYYVRAYIDSNGNNAFDEWESWGYVNYVAVDASKLFTPRPIEITVKSSTPSAIVYIEDMDTDGDGFPDVYEYDVNTSLEKLGPAAGNTFFTRVNPNLAKTLSGLSSLASANLASTPLATMLSLASDGASQSTLAVANLLSGASADTPAVTESVTVSIASFSLTDGITLETTTEVATAESAYVTAADGATVTVSLVAADTLDFADATEVAVKTITIRANATEKTVITADELKAVLDANNLSSKAFFKVKLTSAK